MESEDQGADEVKILPGEEFFDRLEDGRYERCVLRELPPEGRTKEAARGGTGEFFRRIPKDQLTPERIEAAEQMVWDLEEGVFVLLEREPPSGP
jgi:hypothetical protein